MEGTELSRYLDPGSKGGKVDFVIFLFILARFANRLQELVMDGIFGEQLERRVKLFQRCQGLEADGKFGPETSRFFEFWYLDNWNINNILTEYLCFKGEGAMNNLRMIVLRMLGVDTDTELELDGNWGQVAVEKTHILQAMYGLEETGIWDDSLTQALSDDFGIDLAKILPELFIRETIVVGDLDAKED